MKQFASDNVDSFLSNSENDVPLNDHTFQSVRASIFQFRKLQLSYLIKVKEKIILVESLIGLCKKKKKKQDLSQEQDSSPDSILPIT